MPFPLFQYLSAPPAAANPNAAVGNAVSALGHLGSLRRQDTAEKNQMTRFGQTMGLQNRQEDRYAQESELERTKLQAGFIERYNQKLSAGDYAGAAAMAPEMEAIGLSPTLHPQGTPGVSTDEWKPPEAPQVPVPKMEPETPPEKQPFKAQRIPPLLSRYMANQPEKPEPVEEPPAAEAAGAAPDVEPAQAKPQLPVYEFVDRKTGRSYGVIDPNKAKAQNIEKAGRMGEGFVAAVPDGAQNMAAGVVAPAETAGEQEFAIKNALSLIEQQMRSEAAKNHGGGIAPGAFPVGKEAHALQTEIRTTMQAAATDQKVADSNKTLNNIAQGLAGLQEGGTVAERGAVAQLIKSAFPGAISDQERGYITEANGIQGRIANSLGYWVQSGHMDPQLVAQVRRLQEIAASITKQRLAAAAAEVAENWGRTHPELSPEAKEAYIQEGISLHSPEAARKRRESRSPEGIKKPGFLK